MNILAVDDDELQLKVLSASLAAEGLPVPYTATSANKAIKAIKDEFLPFDIFLLDIQMPGVDGIALCEQIRALPEHKDAPIIMITSLTDKSSMKRAFKAGASDYVTKPFDKLELATRIRIASEISRAKVEARHQREKFSDLQREVYETRGSTLESPVTILGIPNVLDYYLLKNFMLELSLTETFSAAAFALKIENFQMLHLAATPGKVYDILTVVASKLSDQLLGQGYFISYSGLGIFVCATRRNRGLDLGELSSELHQQIREVKFSETVKNTEPLRLNFSELQTNTLITLNRRTGLLDKAISRLKSAADGTEKRQGRPMEYRGVMDVKTLLKRAIWGNYA